ncbi:PTS transporter subunit EIIB [Streptomyces sp. HNM0645]|uniref:PTS transporter subunit EIIB n=1 Tax=Streptomyces sp. HNM0645 TaxID=2782343 RepID=UPI0024B6BA71|nr:PTS transporter subunit EIIB [Streptomyces sp. HNM0645]MDI9889173.1 PTS transporter subunit EIIB [Streptomyces sp. HNM0645]
MSKARLIVDGLGGADNIADIEACITRLRTEVNDPGVVDLGALKKAGAHGVLVSAGVVQVVVGPEADSLAEDIKELL